MTLPPSTTLLQIDLNATLGAALVGFGASCAAFGIFTTQVYTYFRRYPDDKTSYKLLVVFLWFLETADQCLIGHSTYYYTITLYAQPVKLLTEKVVWSLVFQILLGALVGTIVKLCFAIRVWRFSKHSILVTGLIICLALGQMALATAYTISGFGSTFAALPGLLVLGSLSLGVGMLTDIFTAGALSYYLRKMRTGQKKSDTLVTSLTVYAVNTGILTSAVSLITLITYALEPTNFIFMAFYFVLSKLYAISFLATLNTRRIIRGRGTDREGTQTHTTANTFVMGTRIRPVTDIEQGYQSSFPSELKIEIQHDVSIVSDSGQDMPEHYYQESGARAI